MKSRKILIPLCAGIVLGATLFSGMAAYAASGVMAERSAHGYGNAATTDAPNRQRRAGRLHDQRGSLEQGGLLPTGQPRRVHWSLR